MISKGIKYIILKKEAKASESEDVMSILFGILTLLSGFIITLLLGTIGLVITIVFAALTIVFAIKKKKENGGGTGSIVCAVIGVIFGLIMFGLLAAASQGIKDTIEKYPGKYDLVEKYADSLKTTGIIGIASKLSKDDVDMDKFKEQFDDLIDKMGASSTSSSTSTSSSSSSTEESSSAE